MTRRRKSPWLSKQAFPMFVLMVVMVLLMYFVPGITNWLPQHMGG